MQVEKRIEDWIEDKVIKHSDTKYVFEIPFSTAAVRSQFGHQHSDKLALTPSKVFLQHIGIPVC